MGSVNFSDMSGNLHLIKLCVGVENLGDLASYRAKQSEQARNEGREDISRHVTRMWPKREAELLNGGSLYWVIKGVVLARQNILRLDEVLGADGIRRCGIIMDPTLIRTQAQPRRAFQGWRYLAAADAPKDIGEFNQNDDAIPDKMYAELASLGVL